MCSIARIDPALISRLTIWAMDSNSSTALQKYNELNKEMEKNNNNEIVPVHGYGVFYDINFQGPQEYSRGGTKPYWELMALRKGY